MDFKLQMGRLLAIFGVHLSLSSQPVNNTENMCTVAYIVPDPPLASFVYKRTEKSRYLISTGASSDRRRLNLCGPR